MRARPAQGRQRPFTPPVLPSAQVTDYLYFETEKEWVLGITDEGEHMTAADGARLGALWRSGPLQRAFELRADRLIAFLAAHSARVMDLFRQVRTCGPLSAPAGHAPVAQKGTAHAAAHHCPPPQA